MYDEIHSANMFFRRMHSARHKNRSCRRSAAPARPVCICSGAGSARRIIVVVFAAQFNTIESAELRRRKTRTLLKLLVKIA